MRKSILSLILIVAILAGLCCGCASEQPTPTVGPTAPPTQPVTQPPTEPPTEPTEPIDTSAMDFLRQLYRDEVLTTPMDYMLINVFPLDDMVYKIVWSVDAPESTVKIIENGDGTVKVDINELCQEDTPYALTASIATAQGVYLTHTWDRIIPKATDMVSIVEAAYQLKRGQQMEDPVTLTGEITSIDKPWSEDYNHITVTIVVEGCKNKPIRCYSLTGENLDLLKKGDVITVSGYLQNYSGRVEFDIGCTLQNWKEIENDEN